MIFPSKFHKTKEYSPDPLRELLSSKVVMVLIVRSAWVCVIGECVLSAEREEESVCVCVWVKCVIVC